MITAVDTSVLLDVFFDDPQFCQTSAAALAQALSEGSVLACDVVWAETAAAFADAALFNHQMKKLNISFSAMEREAARHAGEAWKRYLAHGGTRNRMVSDFLIGAHAQAQCERLLTRDRGFFRKYFKGLAIWEPVQKKK